MARRRPEVQRGPDDRVHANGKGAQHVQAPFDVDDDPRRLPDPRPRGQRQAPGLSRQRRLGAEAARRARHHPVRLRDGIRQRPSRAALSLATPPPPASRGARDACAASSMRAPTRRSSSPATPPRRSTWSPRPMARRFRRGRRDRDHRSWSITPTSCRGISCASGKGAVLKWAPMSDDGEFLLDEFERLLSAKRTKWLLSRTCRTCSAPSSRSRRW